ncbi:MAG: hypothetical protein CVU56_03110 [Deltaproteobacteria bacterium HGW-Deltaproteobacteria-14]|jgi:acetoin utilization protein AcuB|nr:MAG: hypothetical protein CVU56_03110 [Deltaproteobacteria bacterium HGW-Deltaproteobacteria-14]
MDKHHHHNLLHVMTPFPQCVAFGASLDEASALMEEHGIHHLPVREDDGDVVGMLTEQDVATARMAARERGDQLTVGDVCRREVYVVEITRSLAATIRDMAQRRADYALVKRDDHLAGIVTTTDLCLLLADILDPQIDDIIA